MEVEYTLTVDDVQAAQRHHQARRQRGGRPASTAWRLILLAVLFAFMVLTNFNKLLALARDALWVLLGVGIGFGLALLLLAKLRDAFISVRRQLEDPRNRKWRGPWRLAIRPEGLSGTSALERALYAWEGILWIDATADHVFLYTTPYCYIIVPRRAFRDDRHFDEFVDLARRYRDEAKAAGEGDAPVPSSTAITRDIG